jgi:hypothetical protein
MMYTTNTASGRMPSTYTSLRVECETLAQMAADLERFARENEVFKIAPAFHELKARFRKQFQTVASLATV